MILNKDRLIYLYLNLKILRKGTWLKHLKCIKTFLSILYVMNKIVKHQHIFEALNIYKT